MKANLAGTDPLCDQIQFQIDRTKSTIGVTARTGLNKVLTTLIARL